MENKYLLPIIKCYFFDRGTRVVLLFERCEKINICVFLEVKKYFLILALLSLLSFLYFYKRGKVVRAGKGTFFIRQSHLTSGEKRNTFPAYL